MKTICSWLKKDSIKLKKVEGLVRQKKEGVDKSSSSAPSSSSTHSSANNRKSKRTNAPGARTDVAWEHAIDLGQRKVKCKFCNCEFTGGNYRFKHHLARTHKDASACLMVPEDIKVKFQKVVEQIELAASKKRRPFSVEEDEELLESDDRQKRTCTFFQKSKNALSFNCVKNPEFKKMIQMVGDFRRGLDPPSYHEMRVTYLKKEVDYTKVLLEDYKKEWKKTGFTLMSDGWSDRKNRSICNFLVNIPKGTIFLASIDTSEISKTKEKVFAMLDDFVKKIGEEHIVQVVTDNAANYKAAGEMLMDKRKKLFWTPCAAHFIDLMLEDFEKKIEEHKDSPDSKVARIAHKFEGLVPVFKMGHGSGNLKKILDKSLIKTSIPEKTSDPLDGSWVSSASAPSSSSTPSSANSRKSKRVNAPGARTDAAWEHAIDLGQRKVKCKFCSCEFTGGIYRFKHHLARTHKDALACLMVPEDIKVKFQKVVKQMELAASKKRRPFSVDEEEELLESDDRQKRTDTFFSKKLKVQSTLNTINKKDKRDKVCQQIARFFYTSALSFNCVKNLEFKKMIQIVDSTPAMGFIYHAMKKENEEIKSNYKSVQSRPLHVAGYFLNSRTQYSPDFKGDILSLKLNLYMCIEKMCGSGELVDEIDCQLDMFKNKKGHLFNLSTAKHNIDKKTLVDWWDSFGDDTPELKRFAMRVLSLTCSSSGYERNWGAFEMVHSKRRNCLHQQKMNDLVYVMYNLKLTGREQKKMKETTAAIEQLEALDFKHVESDDEWITEEESTQS
nr:hypothetical protein [Tanacetum cinerariifolium]